MDATATFYFDIDLWILRINVNFEKESEYFHVSYEKESEYFLGS